jgi:hypothetical protein
MPALKLPAGALLALLLAAPTARASEIFGGLYAHDINLGITVCCYETGADFELGARTSPLIQAHRWGGLRLYALGSVNTSGGVDFAAAGAAWRAPLSHRLYVQAGLGGAIQSGDTAPFQRLTNRLELGSRFLFEPEATIGWTLSRQWAAELSYVHLSHAQLAGRQNPGMDDLGARVVYRFGG